MKNPKLQRTRLLSLVLTMAMLFSTLSSTVFATEGGTSPAISGLTECHEDHDAACGYKEAMAGTACSHLKEDGSSRCVAETLDMGTACTHTDGCGYTEAVVGADCTHALSCDTLRVEDNSNYAVASEEKGLFAGRFSHYQVFDCARDPAYPAANSLFRVHTFAAPYDDSALGKGTQMTQEAVANKIFYFKPTGNTDGPFILYMANDVNGTDERAVSGNGNINALGKEGFLFISKSTDKGYFISLSQGFDYGGELTYTPTEKGPITADKAASLTGISATPWNPDESLSVVFSSEGADKPATPSQISVRKNPAPAKMGTLPSSPERANFSFAGWNTQKDGLGDNITIDTVLTGNTTVYAQWVERTADSFVIKTPQKLTYTYGDTFDPAGLVITVTYDNDSTQEIAYENNKSKFAFSGATDKLKPGNTKVSITYTENGKSLSKGLDMEVSKRKVTPKLTGVNTKKYDGNTSTTNGSITLENVLPGDGVGVTVSDTDIVFVTKDVGKNKAVNVDGIALSGTDAANYELSTDSLSEVATTAEITPFEATITWAPSSASFTYNGSEQTVTAALSSNLFEGDTCSVTVKDGSKTLPGTYTAKATLSNHNYALQSKNSTYSFTIQKATIAGITVTPTDKAYDGKYENGVTITGLKDTDLVSYSTDEGKNWSDAVPQVGKAGSSTDIWVKVTREHHKDYLSEKVTAKVNAAPTVTIEKPAFDAADIKKVTVGGTVTQGDKPLTSRTFEIRKAGTTDWSKLKPGTEDGKLTTYEQQLNSLVANTEYELRLTAIDSANTSATTTLKFRTQTQNQATGGIEGSVDGGSGTITVTLEMGNTVVASVKGLHNKGKFTFSKLVDGEYNVVATDASGRRVTMMASVTDGKTITLTVMTIGQQQSAVEVKGNIPPVAVAGLQGLFDSETYKGNPAAMDAIAAKGTVEIRLTAKEAKAKDEIDAIKSHVGSDTIALLIDLTVDMIITPPASLSEVKKLKTVDGLLTIAIPLPAEALGKSNYKLYRHHDGAVEALKQIQKEEDKAEGTFRINGKYAYIYSKKFSTYAITYGNSTGGSGGGGGGNSSGGGSGGGNPTVVIPPVAEKPTPNTTGVADLLLTEQHVKYMLGDEKGNFNPTSNITRAEVAQMFYNLLRDKSIAKTASFNDVADAAWYAEAVNTLASMDILKGTDGNFRPAEGITRGEFAAVAGRFAKMEKGNCTFSDVDESLWSYSAIAASSSYGWISGYEDNTFRPEQQIVRAEVVVIVNNMLGRTPDKDYIDANKASLKSFADTASPSYWAWYHIMEATNAHAHSFEQTEEKWTSLQ